MTTRSKRLNSRRNIKKTNWKFRLIGLGVLGGILILALLILSQYSFFPVRDVVFYGNKHLTSEELKGLMRLKGGEDLLGIRCRSLAEELLRSPWIKTASIRKEFPGRLLVKVKEAEPFALLNDTGSVFIIDEEGRRLEELNAEPVQFLPLINSTASSMNRHSLSDALSLVGAIRQTGLLGKQIEITGIEAGRGDLVMAIDGIAVKVGEGQYTEKLIKFMELEDEIKKRWASVDYIDLRFANRVVVKPVKEVSMKEAADKGVQR